MSNCPVCNQPTVGMLCHACSFDRSMDYENYSTLAPLPQGLPSVSGWPHRSGSSSTSLFSCPNCGGRQFTISIPFRACICTCCDQAVSMDQPLEEADAWKKQIARLAQLIHSRRSTMERQKTTKPPLLSKTQAYIRLSQLIRNYTTIIILHQETSEQLRDSWQSYLHHTAQTNQAIDACWEAIEANRLEQANILLDSLSKILANPQVKLLAPGENRQS